MLSFVSLISLGLENVDFLNLHHLQSPVETLTPNSGQGGGHSCGEEDIHI